MTTSSERAKPRWNRVRGGAELPVYIRLDRRPGVARLAVVHGPLDQTAGTAGRAADMFGPRLTVLACGLFISLFVSLVGLRERRMGEI